MPDRSSADRATRALSFGPAADVYERARPGYPAAAVRDLLGPAPRDVIDVGAGTGKLTRAVAGEGHRVVAVDPSAGMLAALRVAVPGVETRVGTAESLPAADRSVDAVVAGQAYHWFDPPVALPEIGRVLRPGGTLGLLWNSRDETVPWVARFGELILSHEDGSTALTEPPMAPPFGRATVRWYDHEQRMTVDGLVDLAHSRSTLLVLAEDERAACLQRVRALGESVAANGVITLPYRLQVWSATRD
ncbi:MAG TPA: class I SAM-dependent methyltransferase [Mycobacteriales bacterium]